MTNASVVFRNDEKDEMKREREREKKNPKQVFHSTRQIIHILMSHVSCHFQPNNTNFDWMNFAFTLKKLILSFTIHLIQLKQLCYDNNNNQKHIFSCFHFVGD